MDRQKCRCGQEIINCVYPSCGTGSADVVHNDDPLNSQIGGSHYTQFQIQPIEFISKNGIGYFEGNVIKYVCRHKFKNGAEDIKKAIHYLQLLLELEYKNE